MVAVQSRTASHGLVNGDRDLHQSSRIGVAHVQFSAKLVGALIQAREAHANIFRFEAGDLLVDALAVVPHAQHRDAFLEVQRDPYLGGGRVPEDVG
jgi:hypothetical protein